MSDAGAISGSGGTGGSGGAGGSGPAPQPASQQSSAQPVRPVRPAQTSQPKQTRQPKPRRPEPEIPPNPTLDDGNDTDFPALYQIADKTAIRARAAYFSWLRAEVVLLALAAFVALFSVLKGPEITVGPIPVHNWPAFAVTIVTSVHAVSLAALFAGFLGLCALLARFYRHSQAFDTRWYGTRATAESVKSAVWRYAVGGRPFPKTSDDPNDPTEVAASQLFIQRLNDAPTDVAADLKNLSFSPDQVITPAMRRLRAAPLAARKAAYQFSRIQNQENWYNGKAVKLGVIAKRWHRALLWIEGAGVVGAGLVAFHVISINIQSVIAAIASAIITWTAAQRYTDLEASYDMTGSELNSIDQGIGEQKDDTTWSAFVDEAEEACSREHHLWRATADSK